MDGRQFDDLLRTLPGTRRAALATILAAMGGLASLPVADAKKRKKKKGCRGCRACTSCVKGKCVPVPDRTACGGECQECMGGQCVNKAAGTSCGGTSQCLDGVCNVRPECISAISVSGCSSPGNVCCSGLCSNVPPPGDVCLQGGTGTPCKVNTDCTSGACVGYRCQ